MTTIRHNLSLVFLFASVFTSLVACNGSNLVFPRSEIESEHLVGTWQVDYGPYQLVDSYEREFIEIVETIELYPDRRFRQLVDEEEISSGAWRFDTDRSSIYLTDAYILTAGSTVAERYKHREMVAMMVGCHDDLVEIDGSELILCVMQVGKAPEGIFLRHLSIGDPDSPVEIKFTRVGEK